MKNTIIPGKLKKLDHTEPLKEKVYNNLLENIIEGNLAPGEQLVEKSIGVWLGVSKSPVRDALHRLSGDGLVVGTPFKGFAVSQISTREFIELMQVRMAIELFCLEQKIDSYSDDDIRDLSESVVNAERYLEGGRDRLAQDSHLDFHYLIVKKFANQLMIGLYEINRNKLTRYLRININKTPDRMRFTHPYHKNILDSIKCKDKAAALLRLREHLADVQKAFLEGPGQRINANGSPQMNPGPKNI